ncbi:transcriptional regulator FtrA [Qipengyuania sphaerica]|uniref:transcriptional regulator FtrA n=1 Tax=Qipengyuania sphaerica TaxID=2867243 RepID=UPI001C878F73|nr:transcriptional regulator FtrA [Qipengyuania sphaerica]MBX7539967.1 transcriptional regulator FtrA [Qipengyuania sphaerica]
MPKASRNPHDVVALVYDDLCTFEFSIAAEIFGLPRPEFAGEWYRFRTASEKRGALRANGGLTVEAQSDLSILPEAGTIVIPGWHTRDERPSPALREALLDAHRGGARIIAICSGTFLLAELGLLDGTRATTHWLYADKLAARFPQVEVEEDRLFVGDGSVYTSAGSSAGIDLCMHIVREDWGSQKANIVARRLVMAPHRDGDQRQFIAAPVASAEGDRLHDFLERLRDDHGVGWTIDRMASEAAMSRRTFIRRFRDATGETPAAYLGRLRVEKARTLLEQGTARLDDIAEEAGFGSLATMQHHFRSRVGCSPSSYRRSFTG